jgi:hypothetical protein
MGYLGYALIRISVQFSLFRCLSDRARWRKKEPHIQRDFRVPSLHSHRILQVDFSDYVDSGQICVTV